MRVCQFRHFGTLNRRSRLDSPTGSEISVTKARFRVKPGGGWVHQMTFKQDFPEIPSSRSMSETVQQPIAPEQAQEIRRLAHDLSNALEVVIQTSFLLGTVPLDENARQWHAMLEKGVKQATEINQKMREQLRLQG